MGHRHRLLRAHRHALNLRLLGHLLRSSKPGDSRFWFSAMHRQRFEFGVGLTLRGAWNVSEVHSGRRWNLLTKRWDIRKFFSRHSSVASRTVRRLAASTVHTAHREIVRSMRPLEQRYARVAAGDQLARANSVAQMQKADLAFDGRQATFVMPGRHLATAGSAAPPISVADVNHLADQVMRQLDHRISAWRERRGRA